MKLAEQEIKMLNKALETQLAALKRAANTEQDSEIQAIRRKQYSDYVTLQAKINSKELFENETSISKQK